MSIFSSIGSALSKGYQAVKSAVSNVVSSLTTSGTGYSPFSGTKNTASVFDAVYGKQNTPSPSAVISKPTSISTGSNIDLGYALRNIGGSISQSQLPTQQQTQQLPVKIGAGTQNVSSSTGLISGTQDFFYSPEPVTLSARTLGVSDGGSTGSLSSPGTQPIQLNTSPSNVSVGQTDSTRLASGFSGYRKYNAATRQWEDVAAPVEEKQPTLDEKLKERMDLLNQYVGIKPDVYEDPQVIQARNEVNRIKQELRAPTDELNAVIAKQNQDLLQLRQTGAKEGVTEAVYGQQQNAINYNAAIRALPLQANIARIQGNLELAQDYLKEEMNIKLSQIDRQYEYNKIRLASIVNFLDKEEERTYKEITTANDRAHQEQRDLEKVKTELLQNAVPQGAPMSIQNSIRNAQSIPEAIMAAGRYGGDIAERAYKQAQTAKMQAESSKPITEDSPLYQGLNNTTATAVRSVVSKYGSEPTIQNFATIQEGRNFANSIDTKTKNPADDQALIYSLAKVLDPGSVVREGEYATAQKYSQSWVNAYGKGVTQAIAGTGFLSETARTNIKKTIEQKYKSSKVSYEKQYNEYVNQINNLTGRDDGNKFLRSYDTSTNETISGTTEGSTKVWNGVTYKVVNGVWTPQ